MTNIFAKYYLGTITRPTKTFEDLLGDNKHLSFGFYAVLITAILYTFVYVFLIFGGGQPFKPWLNIPLETYYKYNVFFCAPSMFLGWILAAGVVHTLSRLLTRTGSFEQTLSVFGFGISVSSWTTGIHDIITGFLGALHIINQHDYETALNSPTIWRALLWIQMIAYLIWFIFLFSKATKSVYHLTTGSSIQLGILGFLIYQFFFFIFNR
jgi:Yip1 domain